MRAVFSYVTKSSPDSQMQKRNKDETKNLITFIIYIKMIKVIQTLSYLISGVLQKKGKKYIKGRYKRRRANPAQPKSKSGPGGVESHADVPSQPLPKLEPSILLLTRISSWSAMLEGAKDS